MSNPLEKWADRIADAIAEEGARVRADLAAGLTKTLDAQRVSGALAIPIGTGGRLRTSRGRLVGWSLRETAGAAATVTVYAGADTTDPTKIVAVLQLAANGAQTLLPALPGVFFAEGVTVVVAGALVGALYFAAD